MADLIPFAVGRNGLLVTLSTDRLRGERLEPERAGRPRKGLTTDVARRIARSPRPPSHRMAAGPGVAGGPNSSGAGLVARRCLIVDGRDEGHAS